MVLAIKRFIPVMPNTSWQGYKGPGVNSISHEPLTPSINVPLHISANSCIPDIFQHQSKLWFSAPEHYKSIEIIKHGTAIRSRKK